MSSPAARAAAGVAAAGEFLPFRVSVRGLAA